MTDNIKSYDVPSTDSLSPSEAESTLNKIHTDSAGDKLHPWLNPMHPQSSEFKETMTQLFAIKAEGKPKNDEVDFNELPAQLHRVSQAKEVMSDLVELGYERADIPKNLNPGELKALKQHRLNGRKEFSRLEAELQVDLRQLKAPAHIMSLYESFRTSPDSGIKSDTVDSLIKWIAKSKKEKGFLL